MKSSRTAGHSRSSNPFNQESERSKDSIGEDSDDGEELIVVNSFLETEGLRDSAGSAALRLHAKLGKTDMNDSNLSSKRGSV